MNEIFIPIICKGIDPTQAKLYLDQFVGPDDGVNLRIESHRDPLATPVLVALLTATGAAFGALVTGLFEVVSSKNTQRITIYGKTGRKLEVPASASDEKIEKLIQHAKELDIERIVMEE